MVEVNCLGDVCPVPIMQFRKHEGTCYKGQAFKLITDHSCAVESILDYCRKKSLYIKVDEPMNGIWELVHEKY